MERREERAHRWKDLLVDALNQEDYRTFEAIWTEGRDKNLWLDLGYERVEDFCRGELDWELEEILGTLTTNDLSILEERIEFPASLPDTDWRR